MPICFLQPTFPATNPSILWKAPFVLKALTRSGRMAEGWVWEGGGHAPLAPFALVCSRRTANDDRAHPGRLRGTVVTRPLWGFHSGGRPVSLGHRRISN